MTTMIPLVARFGRIGDMVLQTPLLHLLRARYGRPCRVLSAGPWSSELFAHHPDVSEVWQLRSRHRVPLASPQHWRMVRLLRSHAGPVYVSEDVPKHVRRIRRLLARAGIGNERCLFLTDQPSSDDHWIERLLRFGAATPAFANADEHVAESRDFHSAPRLHVDADGERDCQAWLQRRGLAGRSIVLIQPGNKRSTRWTFKRDDAKQWPAENWATLLHRIREQMPEAGLVLCGAAGESRMLHAIGALSGCNAQVATDDLPLRRLMALMAAAHSMIAVDTGPAHMASALGCPLVVLYGSESPRIWGRRSATGQPVIELCGAQGRSAAEISVEQVVHAWRSIAAPAAVPTFARRVASSR